MVNTDEFRGGSYDTKPHRSQFVQLVIWGNNMYALDGDGQIWIYVEWCHKWCKQNMKREGDDETN